MTNRKRIYNINRDVFLNEDDISFYLLGAFMSDGNLSKSKKSFNIGSIDKEWIEDIKNLITPSYVIKHKKIKNCNDFYSAKFNDLICYNWFISWGCIPRKSLILEIKKEIPNKYIPDFLRGIVDGDGTIVISTYSKQRKRGLVKYRKIICSISSSSKIFIDQIKKLIPSNIKYSISTIYKNKTHLFKDKIIKFNSNHYKLNFNDSYAKKFLEYIYYPNHKISLIRKNILSKNAISTPNELEIN